MEPYAVFGFIVSSRTKTKGRASLAAAFFLSDVLEVGRCGQRRKASAC